MSRNRRQASRNRRQAPRNRRRGSRNWRPQKGVSLGPDVVAGVTRSIRVDGPTFVALLTPNGAPFELYSATSCSSDRQREGGSTPSSSLGPAAADRPISSAVAGPRVCWTPAVSSSSSMLRRLSSDGLTAIGPPGITAWGAASSACRRRKATGRHFSSCPSTSSSHRLRFPFSITSLVCSIIHQHGCDEGRGGRMAHRGGGENTMVIYWLLRTRYQVSLYFSAAKRFFLCATKT